MIPLVLWFDALGHILSYFRQLLSGATPEQVQKGLDDLFGGFYDTD